MKIKKLLVACGAIFATLGLVACSTNEPYEEPTDEVVKYIVTFDYKNGNPSTAKQIQEGQKVEKPTDPEKFDYVFKGWYLEETYQTQWDFDKDTVTKNIVLYARWDEIPKYSITFNMHEHGTSPTSITEATALPNPLPTIEDEEGWHFVGWYLEDSFMTLAEAGKAIETDTTLHAKWESKGEPIPEKYSVTYDMQGHGVAPIAITDVTTLPNPLPVVEDVEGWHFAGWYLEETFTTLAVSGATIKADTTLYAKWEEKKVTPPTPKKYSITYDVQGHGVAPANVAEATAFPNPLPTVEDVEGWHFIGWYLDKDYSILAEAGKTITENTTLYAKWEEQETPPAPEKFSISYNINGKGEQPTNVKEALILPEELPVLTDSESVFAGWYLDADFDTKATPGMVLTEDVTLYAKWVDQNAFMIDKAEGYLEGAYLEWKTFADCTEYNVYYKKSSENDSSYKQIDEPLIREYPNKYRADILGLAAGNYVVKAVPLQNNEELNTAATESVTVVAHERSGFAFSQNSKYKTASGAYNDDGTLKSDAVVVYVTASNAKTVTCNLNINGVSTKLTGIQGILDGKQQANSTQPLCIRFLGLIKASDLDAMGSSAEGLQIKGKAAFSELNVTIEGVGEDTALFGFGFLARNCGNVEFRNFAVMNQMDDGISIDTDNCNIWVHNLDIYYGKKGSGDKAKGDGSVDTKISTNVTISYNHFWDSGKCNLQGMKSEKEDNYITYHHNWYDHSDSRHPRIRTCTVHIYNNYFDGNAKYGVGVTTSASAFVENNYFRNCKNPMMSAAQGTDALGDGTFSGESGGIIKAYGNHIEGGSDCKVISYQENSSSFDAYVATSRDEQVPSSVKTLSGGTTYNNFDTNSSLMYTYNVDTPEVAREKVMKYAGRVNGGDLKWTFDNATQDRNYEIIPELSNAVLSYKSTLVRVLGIEGTLGEYTPDNGDDEGEGNSPVVADSVTHNFTTDGMTSSVFTITGNLSTSKGTATYKGLNLTQCLKLESATEIKFNTNDNMTLVLVFGEASATIKVDGTKYTASNGIITVTLSSGAHTITKADSANLFYLELSKSA